MTVYATHRFKAADIEHAGRRVEDDGDLYRVQLPDGTGAVFVSDRAIDALGDRIGAPFVARRLNTFAARVGAGEALGCLAGRGRNGAAVELAPDGTIDEF
jgi:hypothetical protein